MKLLNFLPEDFLERRSRRRATFVCVAAGGGSLLVIGVVAAYTLFTMLGLAQVRSLVETQYQEASAQIDTLRQLEERKMGLLKKVELSTALLERVPRSHLLARLVNHLPAHTSLTMVLMKVEDVEVKKPDAASGNSPKSGAAGAKGTANGEAAALATGDGNESPKSAPGKRSGGKSAKGDMVKIKQCTFRIDGLAETDVQVAEYLSRLSSDPMFRDVDLQFSEEFPQREGVTMRKFQLSLRLSPEAEKILDSATTGVATLAIATPAPSPAKDKP